MNTQKYWEMHAERHPYWAVVTWDKFKGLNPSPETLMEFFATGEKHIAGVFEVIESFHPGFAPRTALDFGCGVGRLLIPLAERGMDVTGVDISEKMLALSRENLTSRNLAVEALTTSLEGLQSDNRYDLVHSFIVLQHIPVRQAVRIFEALLKRVSDQGIAVLHLTYASSSDRLGSLRKYALAKVRGHVLRSKLLTGFFVAVRGNVPNPPILMENFPLNEVFSLLHDGGFNSIHVRPSFHGMRGLVIFAQRIPDQKLAF